MTPDYTKQHRPLRGWSSWNAFGKSVNEEKVIAQIDALAAGPLARAGYDCINIDDFWQDGRDPVTGRVRANPEAFPHGMKYLADYAHAKGIRIGLYTDGGDNLCGSVSGKRPYGRGVGLYRHEEDLWMYLSDGRYRDAYAREHPEDPGVECWGFDFIKIDWCGGRDHNLDKEERYTCYDRIIRDIEAHTGKDKVLNICCWGYFGPWMQRVGDSWRCGGDIDAGGSRFDSVMDCIDSMKRYGRFSVPGHTADPDMMIVGKHLTPTEDRAHFVMWCMFSVPLVMGCDLTSMTPETAALVTDPELLALNDDPLGRSAVCLGTLGEAAELWFKHTAPLHGPNGAIALFNRGGREETVTLDLSRLCVGGEAAVRDLTEHRELGILRSLTVTLPPHAAAVWRLHAEEGFVCRDFGAVREEEVELPRANPELLSPLSVRLYEEQFGALLIDVRTRDEYDEYHLPGAVHIEYGDLPFSPDLLPADKKAHLVVYCGEGKRSAQAFHELKRMQYENVYCLGDMKAYRRMFDPDTGAGTKPD